MNTMIKTAVAGALALTAAAAQAEPTRLFSQEMGEVAANDSFSAEISYANWSDGLGAGLRAGAFGGEVLINTKDNYGTLNGYGLDYSGLDYSNIGYKASIGKGMALYGLLSYYSFDNGAGLSDSFTDIAIGFAYTYRSGDLTLNVNPEIITDDQGVAGPRGGDTTIFIRGGVAYALPVRTAGKISLIGELVLEDNDVLDTTLNLGARWEPRKDVTLDFVVYNDRGDNGSETGIPGAIRLNVAF